MKWLRRCKVFFSILSTAAVLAIPIGLVGCTGGCKSAERGAYISSGVTHATATTALRGWNQYVTAEHAKIATLAQTDPAKAEAQKKELLEKEAKVKDAWGKYQQSQITMLTAAREFGKVPTGSTNAPAASDQLTAAVAAASTTLDEVIGLLTAFGIQLD